MADDEDARDFTKKYNTDLSPKEDANFDDWVKKQSSSVGRDVSKDLYDYDLKGWWKSNPNTDLQGGHLTDQFKKPNHPTFSTGSQYSGQDGLMGGQWSQAQNGSFSFAPGPTNLQNFNPSELSDYFRRVEPGNQLLLPSQ